ncbi:hypothetical protein CC78DRAFT_579379 [Lojkania enalia]|uniref:Uncharacterized protein n=1 Tax=Lojkania enalia TaxID=147567 RepID=A0A9P4KB50_9PLEO|nr:hypothetical protein CC78DRAFT_579379 [Didymosphaeria enalia]
MNATGNASPRDEKVLTRDEEVPRCVENVLKNYEKSDTRLYEELMKLTMKECEELLKNINRETKNKDKNEKDIREKDRNEEENNEKGIKTVVQGRTKKYDSLKEKLKDLEEDRNKDPEEHKYKDLEEGDWLKDRLTKLEKNSNKIPKFRDWVSEGHDIYKHPEMGDLAGVRIGLYFPDEIVEAVNEIKKRFDVEYFFGMVMGGRNVTKGKNLDICKHLDGQWRNRNNNPWKNYGYKPVEIQVGTVVTQFGPRCNTTSSTKNPDNIRSMLTMERMMDAINGLAITTDVLLKELTGNMEEAKKEASRQLFTDGADFLNCLQSA